MSQGLIKKGLLSGAVAAAAFAAAPTQSDAGLIYDIRVVGGTALAGGSTADGGQIAQTGTVSLQVWARVSGTDGQNLNEYLQTNYLTVVSTEVSGDAFNSTMTATRAAPFNSTAGRNGAAGNITNDGVQDWGSASTSINDPAYMLARSPLATQAGTIAGAVQVDADTWDVRLANFTVNITSINGLGETQIAVAKPTATTGGTSAYAIWWDDAPVLEDPDGVPNSGDEVHQTDSATSSVANSASPATATLYGNFVTLSVIPEPTGLAMIGLAGLGFMARRRRA